MPVINKLQHTVLVAVDVDKHGLLLLNKNLFLLAILSNVKLIVLIGRKTHWIKRETTQFQISVLIEISLILMPVINKQVHTVLVAVDVDNHGLLLLNKRASQPVTPLNAKLTVPTGRKIHWIKREIIPYQTSESTEIFLIHMPVINKLLDTVQEKVQDVDNHGLLLPKWKKNLSQLVTLSNAKLTALIGRRILWTKRETTPFQTSVLTEISLIPMPVINKLLHTAREIKQDVDKHGSLVELNKNRLQLF